MDAATMHRLNASRWFVPAMEMAAEEDGFRLAALLHRLGISRSMVRRVVDQLLAHGWIVPNPGHGHPLRPEFIPTAEGKRIGLWCAQVMATRRRLKLEPAHLGRWSLPVLGRMGHEWRRFSELEQELEPISPRALSMTLKQLVGHRLAIRRLQESYPPTAFYGATDRGLELAKSAA
jgi:DNA-binding HxlR family transcriptional regulator